MAEAVQLEGLVTIAGGLHDYTKLKPGTMRTSAQLYMEGTTNWHLREDLFYTANVAMYEVKDGEPWLHFLSGDDNVFFKNIGEACKYENHGKYVVPVNEVEQARAAAKSFKMSDLGLKINKFPEEIWGFAGITFKPDNYQGLSPTQRAFAEAVYGEGEDFKAVMEGLNEDTSITGIRVLNPEEVKKYFNDHPTEKAIAYVCSLEDCRSGLFFQAYDHIFENGRYRIRGVPLSSAESGAKSRTNFSVLQLDLEERTVGHLFLHRDPWFLKTDSFLEDPNDNILLISRNKGEISFDDERIIDLRRRNPFLQSNHYNDARELLIRAIKCGYDVKSAILNNISDPHGIGKPREYFISHDIGDGRQTKFVFLHELGTMLGIEAQVEEEVRAYAEAYNDFWEVRINSGKMTTIITQQKKKELEGYQRCLTAEYKPSFPLSDGDRKILEILSSLTPKKLEEYSKKYFSEPTR